MPPGPPVGGDGPALEPGGNRLRLNGHPSGQPTARSPRSEGPSAARAGVEGKAAGEDRGERTPSSVSEDRSRPTHLCAFARAAKMAERAGFEPATGCPEPHFQCGAIVH